MSDQVREALENMKHVMTLKPTGTPRTGRALLPDEQGLIYEFAQFWGAYLDAALAALSAPPTDERVALRGVWPDGREGTEPVCRDLEKAIGAGFRVTGVRYFAAPPEPKPDPEWAEVVRCVDAFREVMLGKLAENRAKKGCREGWVNDEPSDLLARVREEVDEMEDASKWSGDGGYYAKLVRECADVANMAMMVADAAGALRVPPEPKPDATGGFVPRPHLPAGSPVQPPRLVPQSVFTGPPPETDLPAQIEAYREHPLIAKPDATGGPTPGRIRELLAKGDAVARDMAASTREMRAGRHGGVVVGGVAPSPEAAGDPLAKMPTCSRCGVDKLIGITSLAEGACVHCRNAEHARKALATATAELERVRGEKESAKDWAIRAMNDAQGLEARLVDSQREVAALRAKLEEAERDRDWQQDRAGKANARADAAEAKAKEAERERDEWKGVASRMTVRLSDAERRIAEAVKDAKYLTDLLGDEFPEAATTARRIVHALTTSGTEGSND